MALWTGWAVSWALLAVWLVTSTTAYVPSPRLNYRQRMESASSESSDEVPLLVAAAPPFPLPSSRSGAAVEAMVEDRPSAPVLRASYVPDDVLRVLQATIRGRHRAAQDLADLDFLDFL